jgi:hypothetical protein
VSGGLILADVDCPYCGEPNEIEVDPSGGSRQTYEEDCQVCCRPWTVKVRIDAEGQASVHLSAQDETSLDD